MQQERGSSSQDRKQLQDRRLLKPMQGGSENQQVLQQQQPQNCPRCESLNTKFCYYNNYSLSQPRYFCKTCRRYWTQGGTLRNVPVGGGCRKGKRTKISSPTDEPSSVPSKPLQPNIISSPNLVLRSKEPASPATASSVAASTASYYPIGGFLSSLAAVHTQSFNPSQQLHQARNSTNHIGGTSGLGLLQGFSTVVPSFGSSSSQQIEQSQIIYQMGDLREKSLNPMYQQNPPSDHHQESLAQSRRPGAGNSSQPHEGWNIQGFLNTDSNNLSNVPADDHHYTDVWSASTTNTAGSFNPNHQWPGYDPPL